VTPKISRRQFITLALLTGLASGCRPPATPEPTSPSSPTAPADMHFALENDSIAYAPHPRGCDATSVRGSVRLADGSPLSGMVVRLWADDPAAPIDMVTGADGMYAADIAQGTPRTSFHLQLLDPTKENRLSDVIIAEATGSCELNDLTLNFVPAAQ
jgi:hypothetical protein